MWPTLDDLPALMEKQREIIDTLPKEMPTGAPNRVCLELAAIKQYHSKILNAQRQLKFELLGLFGNIRF